MAVDETLDAGPAEDAATTGGRRAGSAKTSWLGACTGFGATFELFRQRRFQPDVSVVDGC
jgi:hypothetical protein